MIRSEMMDRMPSSEYLEWMLLEQIEPFGEMGEYVRAGRIVATLANVNRQPSQKAYRPSDFMPELVPGSGPLSGEEQEAAKMHALFLSFKAGRDRKRKLTN